ncbi:MAG TPA: MogA/MoaB family molybdenum cofactor biosynthesis protein [Gemmatimonadaceae bacterium]|jgi:molybdenum cofactor synthesis domain-containing protein
MRVAILTISDAGARGERTDTSGEAAENWALGRRYSVVARALVPDETVAIVAQLVDWCDSHAADLVLTTGGTGLSDRDVTPEATRAVIEREALGIAERIRILSIQSFPRAALSRGLAGVRKKTLIVNLPGSTSGVNDGLDALGPIVDHAINVLRGDRLDHPETAEAGARPTPPPQLPAK